MRLIVLDFFEAGIANAEMMGYFVADHLLNFHLDIHFVRAAALGFDSLLENSDLIRCHHAVTGIAVG